MEFDVTLQYAPSDGEFSYVRFQNNIQSIFNRVRLLYGATPLEDIPYYNVIVRQLTEWTSSNNQGVMDQTSIAEGIGGTCIAGDGTITADGTSIVVNSNTRQKMIQGVDSTLNISPTGMTTGGLATVFIQGAGTVPNASVAINSGAAVGSQLPTLTGMTGKIHSNMTQGYSTRRYQIQFALGLFNQEKLIPTKYMASQLAIEITLENAEACMYYQPSATVTKAVTGVTSIGTPSAIAPSYSVSNVNLIPEILEFDASYDESFLMGLQKGGVPIKFATWNNYRFSNNGVSSINLQIQERSRSVKAIFCLQRRDPPSINRDSGAAFFNTALGPSGTGLAAANTTFQEYQYRIGGRYFPAQPVQCSTEVGGRVPNGGCEAFVELAKAVNTLGDYRLSVPVNGTRWAMNPGAEDPSINSVHAILGEYDFDFALSGYKWTGSPIVDRTYRPGKAGDEPTPPDAAKFMSSSSAQAGNIGSSCFAMAIDLETSNGLEISGLNAEEQSDISLIARFSDTQSPGFVFDVFTYIDSMIVLRENNVNFILIVGFRINSISNLCDCFNKWVISVLTKLLNMLN